MTHVTGTTTTTNPPVTGVLWSITKMVTLAPTFVDHIRLGQEDVFLPPQLILWDTMRGSTCLITLPQQQQPQSQMPSRAYANYATNPLPVSFSFRAAPPNNF